jgi:hypothetical protein
MNGVNVRANRVLKLATSLGLATALTASLGLVPAQAAGFGLTIDKVSVLNPTGDTITANIAGLAGDQGIYVRLCAMPADAATNQSSRPTQCDGQGKWVSNLVASQVIGAGKASEPVKLDVKAVFTVKDATVDCTKVACAIHTRRDHFGGAGDFALDRYYPVSFGAPTATAVYKSGRVAVTVNGAAGKTISFKLGDRVLKRTASSQNFVFSVVSKEKSVKVSATVDAQPILNATLKR